MWMLDPSCTTEAASCFVFIWNQLLISPREEIRLHHWLHPLRSRHCSRARRLPWLHPSRPHPCHWGWGSQSGTATCAKRWMIGRQALPRPTSPLYVTSVIVLSLVLYCCVARWLWWWRGRGEGKKSGVKLNGLLAVGRFSLEVRRRAGADGQQGGGGGRPEPSRLFYVLHSWVTVIPLVSSFPGMFSSAVAILIPF